MRKIFVILISCLLAVSCSKDEKTQEEKGQDIFNMLIGKWQFSRMAWDAEFKEILTDEEFIEIAGAPIQDCDKDNYIEFFPNSSVINKFGCNNAEDEFGYFEITFFDEKPFLNLSGKAGLFISSHIIYAGSRSLISITRNTFIILFHYNKDRACYVEFKRID